VIIVLRTSFIEVGKVDAGSPLLVLFLYENEVREPIWIKHLSDEASLK